MTTKTQSCGRPSSPRKFFARLYGHLETKTDREKPRTSPTSAIVTDPEHHVSIEEQVPEVSFEDRNDTALPRRTPKAVIHRRLPNASNARTTDNLDDVDPAEEEERQPEASSQYPLPFLQGPLLLPAIGPNLQLSHLSNLSYLSHIGRSPPHSRAGIPPLMEAHFHGFSAFRKFFVEICIVLCLFLRTGSSHVGKV